MKNIIIRKLKKEDIKAITEIMLEFPRSYPEYYVNSNKRGGIQWLSNYLIDSKDVKDACGFVIEADNKIVGHIAYMKDVRCFEGGVYELLGLVIDKNFHNKGLGKLLIKHAEDKLKKIGGRIVWLQSSKEGKNYYEKIGYKTIGIFRDYWGKDRDRHIVSREI